MNLNFG